MKKLFISLGLCLALALPQAALAAPEDGVQQFLKMAQDTQDTYLVGFLDCFILYGAEIDFKFPQNVTKRQVVGVIKKYIKDTPHEWHKGLPALCVTAIAKNFPQQK